MQFFKTKKECIDALEKGIICNKDITKYFHTADYTSFFDIIKKAACPGYYEYISDTQIAKLFFDIEVYPHQPHFDNPEDIVNVIRSVFGDKFILLESHSLEKKSFHLIYPGIHFRNVLELKKVILDQGELKRFVELKIIDTSVYRSGLFRTIYSTKKGQNRPLVLSEYSKITDPMDSFICNIPQDTNFYSVESVDSPAVIKRKRKRKSIVGTDDTQTLYDFVKLHYKLSDNDIDKIKVGDINIIDRKSTRLNSSHERLSRMPSSA